MKPGDGSEEHFSLTHFDGIVSWVEWRESDWQRFCGFAELKLLMKLQKSLRIYNNIIQLMAAAEADVKREGFYAILGHTQQGCGKLLGSYDYN